MRGVAGQPVGLFCYIAANLLDKTIGAEFAAYIATVCYPGSCQINSSCYTFDGISPTFDVVTQQSHASERFSGYVDLRLFTQCVPVKASSYPTSNQRMVLKLLAQVRLYMIAYVPRQGEPVLKEKSSEKQACEFDVKKVQILLSVH